LIVALPARAKLNLELKVTGRRPDGQHEVDTLLQAVDLHDLLEVEVADRTSLEVLGLPAPPGPSNLVLQALASLEELTGQTMPVRFRLHKRIPSGAGLGGASSDAATALAAVSRLYGLDHELEEVGERLGADVPFFVHGGAARARGRGEILEPLPFRPGWFALAWPGLEVSTGHVYAAWDEAGGDGPNHLQRAAFQTAPGLADFAAELGPGWQMTGSGSAFFKPVDDRQAGAAAIRHLSCWTEVCRAVPRW
jgi:4-diphosphocytidyl-2-C-methyl-D-erythritol kinase